MNHQQPAEDFEWSRVPTPGPGTAWAEKAVRLMTEPAQASLSSPFEAARDPALGITNLALDLPLLLPPLTEFFIYTLDPTPLFSTFFFLSENCGYSEGLYKGGKT